MERRMSLAFCVIISCLAGCFISASAAQYGCGGTQYACDNGRCIPNQWLCDHEDDCKDNSDENECEHTECSAEEFTCDATSKDCMPIAWKCDGEFDCVDKSDEVGCANITKSCTDEQFSCGLVDKRCIDASFVCDGHVDCPSLLDESNSTCFNRNCQDDEYQCKSDKRCISKRWKCDSDLDCADGSDEHSCSPNICEHNQWMCENKHCIPENWHCDGSIDCTDKSDEVNCTTSVVTPSPHCDIDEFYCKISHECIHKAWVCDADRDCDDGTDEDNCGHLTCAPDQFHCDRGHCILKHLECDGIDHCGDNSDESHCHYECHPHTEFDCSISEDEHDCISVNSTCDQKNDCKNGRDEDASLCQHDYRDSCKNNNGGCSQECVANRISFFCVCAAGYHLGDDLMTCEDIDECLLPGSCSQFCHNSVGSFKCGCHPGYELDLGDKSTCRVEGVEPILFFSNRRDLRQMHLYSGHYRSLLDDVRNAIAIDYDVKNRMLFLSDVSMENISKVNLNENWVPVSNSNEVIAKEDISIPDGLALDWIHQNIYWTDTGKNCIEVMSLGGTKVAKGRKTLINSDLDEPRAIVVDPREKHRALYWTDWGNVPKIERSGLDGSSRQALVTSGIQWPNGLTLDYKTNRLFWVDAKLHTIASSDLFGQKRDIILTSFVHLAHPFAIAVFESDVYWTDWQAQSILKVSKNQNAGNVTTVIRDLVSPMDLHIYHQMTQPEGVNVCDQKCSHICLPRVASPGYTCACPSDTATVKYTLNYDGTMCLSGIHDEETKSKIENNEGKTKISKEDQLDNEKDIGKKITSENSKSSFGDGGHVKFIAIFVSVSMLALVIIVVAVIFIRRSYRRRNIKTMNFDNPVYRKTTESEDQFSLNKHPHRSLPTRQISTVLEPLTSTNEYV